MNDNITSFNSYHSQKSAVKVLNKIKLSSPRKCSAFTQVAEHFRLSLGTNRVIDLFDVVRHVLWLLLCPCIPVYPVGIINRIAVQSSGASIERMNPMNLFSRPSEFHSVAQSQRIRTDRHIEDRNYFVIGLCCKKTGSVK